MRDDGRAGGGGADSGDWDLGKYDLCWWNNGGKSLNMNFGQS